MGGSFFCGQCCDDMNKVLRIDFVCNYNGGSEGLFFLCIAGIDLAVFCHHVM